MRRRFHHQLWWFCPPRLVDNMPRIQRRFRTSQLLLLVGLLHQPAPCTSKVLFRLTSHAPRSKARALEASPSRQELDVKAAFSKPPFGHPNTKAQPPNMAALHGSYLRGTHPALRTVGSAAFVFLFAADTRHAQPTRHRLESEASSHDTSSKLFRSILRLRRLVLP